MYMDGLTYIYLIMMCHWHMTHTNTHSYTQIKHNLDVIIEVVEVGRYLHLLWLWLRDLDLVLVPEKFIIPYLIRMSGH